MGLKSGSFFPNIALPLPSNVINETGLTYLNLGLLTYKTGIIRVATSRD